MTFGPNAAKKTIGHRVAIFRQINKAQQMTNHDALELFPQNYHEPYYVSYTNEDFSALGTSCGMTHIRDVKAFVSKVIVFDKPARRAPAVFSHSETVEPLMK